MGLYPHLSILENKSLQPLLDYFHYQASQFTLPLCVTKQGTYKLQGLCTAAVFDQLGYPNQSLFREHNAVLYFRNVLLQ